MEDSHGFSEMFIFADSDEVDEWGEQSRTTDDSIRRIQQVTGILCALL
jgi:hypothetical protein